MTDTDPTRAAIEAMVAAADLEDVAFTVLAPWRKTEIMTAAFHAQHGIVRVVPIKATDEMADGADGACPARYLTGAMAAGDLTKAADRPILDDKTAGILERDFGIED